MDRADHGAYSVEVIQTSDAGVAEGKFILAGVALLRNLTTSGYRRSNSRRPDMKI